MYFNLLVLFLLLYFSIFTILIFFSVPLQLNRSVITLLTGLGVRHRMFLRLQEEMLKSLTDMLFDENEASKFLQSKTPTDLYNFIDLSKSGIYLTTDPFFKSLLLALHRHHIGRYNNEFLRFSFYLYYFGKNKCLPTFIVKVVLPWSIFSFWFLIANILNKKLSSFTKLFT